MKKLNLFILLIATIFISCSKDDDASDNVEITETNLIGKWQLIKIEEDGKEDILNDCDKKDISQFSIKEDGSKLAKFVGHHESNEECTSSISADYTWELSGNKLSTFILTNHDRDYEDVYTIITLSKTTLKLESKETYKDDQGIEKTSIYAETFTYIGKPDIEPSTSININETKLIGKWQFTGSTENGVVMQSDECDLKTTIEYKTGNIIDYFYSYANGTGDTCSNSAYSSPWSLSGNIISYDTGDGSETIIELNSEILKVQYPHEDVNQDGTVTKNIYVDTYKKI
ncbi:lipocalin family protein [Aquimarina muelleri]|uniref:Lipocalin-like domain-containing protein n=1 Tax=Aquimarina muelleri TaxID=279356 RepID=A0A918N3T3_9FLAO|nr:lipocalin family protein [Aquimarina muelleri]MCX2762391.1 lipocalin family protein [Aquimarina muelleri]GGX24900.1 hypothetical protein GCM10007384_27430 [Aquimarina muelleri]